MPNNSELEALSHFTHEEICAELVDIHSKLTFLSTEVALTLQQRIMMVECQGRIRKLIGRRPQKEF
jgi:hypothetical protein